MAAHIVMLPPCCLGTLTMSRCPMMFLPLHCVLASQLHQGKGTHGPLQQHLTPTLFETGKRKHYSIIWLCEQTWSSQYCVMTVQWEVSIAYLTIFIGQLFDSTELCSDGVQYNCFRSRWCFFWSQSSSDKVTGWTLLNISNDMLFQLSQSYATVCSDHVYDVFLLLWGEQLSNPNPDPNLQKHDVSSFSVWNEMFEKSYCNCWEISPCQKKYINTVKHIPFVFMFYSVL